MGLWKSGDVRYSEGLLFRNTQIAYNTMMFVSPKKKKGFLNPNICGIILKVP